MSTGDDHRKPPSRPVSATENSWCRAAPGGTGTTVLALFLTKPPDLTLLQNALHNLQNSHPILNSTLHYNPTSNSFSFITPTTPQLHLQAFDLQSTAQILSSSSPSPSLSPFQILLEHELNRNAWPNPDPSSEEPTETEVLHASVYAMEGPTWAVVLRQHTAACDRPAAVWVLKELMRMIKGGGIGMEVEGKMEGSLGIEEYIPSGKGNKPFWARGMDVLGYSLNAFRLANLDFVDPTSARCSQVVRLQLDSHLTTKLLEECKRRGIKLFGAVAAAALIAARVSKRLPEGQWEKYAVVTLVDCRSILDPPLPPHHVGFYHSAILNTHDMKGGEELWELAGRTYSSYQQSKNWNKHFSDMSDLNFLMCKAIENPGLTPSSSLRTSFLSVFEDPLIDEANSSEFEELGIVDYFGCASVHGVGPSIAIFDAIRNGGLDCACVYPSPLHSREQMQDLVDNMKKFLIEGCD